MNFMQPIPQQRPQEAPSPAPDAISCPACGGGPAVRGVRPYAIIFKDARVTIDQAAYYCEQCGVGTMKGPDTALANFAFEELRARVEGVLSPTAIRTVRKALGLTQRQAGERLGGGPAAFQKYESGIVTISRGMSRLLSLLAANPTLVEQMRPHAPAVLALRHAAQDAARNRILDRILEDTDAITF